MCTPLATKFADNPQNSAPRISSNSIATIENDNKPENVTPERTLVQEPLLFSQRHPRQRYGSMPRKKEEREERVTTRDDCEGERGHDKRQIEESFP